MKVERKEFKLGSSKAVSRDLAPKAKKIWTANCSVAGVKFLSVQNSPNACS